MAGPKKNKSPSHLLWWSQLTNREELLRSSTRCLKGVMGFVRGPMEDKESSPGMSLPSKPRSVAAMTSAWYSWMTVTTSEDQFVSWRVLYLQQSHGQTWTPDQFQPTDLSVIFHSLITVLVLIDTMKLSVIFSCSSIYWKINAPVREDQLKGCCWKIRVLHSHWSR